MGTRAGAGVCVLRASMAEEMELNCNGLAQIVAWITMKNPDEKWQNLLFGTRSLFFALPAHSLSAHSWLFHSYLVVLATTDRYNSGHCSCSNPDVALHGSAFGQRQGRPEASRQSLRESGTLARAAGLQSYVGWPYRGGKVSGDKRL